MFVRLCDREICERGGGGGEWVIWSQGKWKPSFRPLDLSRKRLVLWECVGLLATVSENPNREDEGQGQGRRTTDLRENFGQKWKDRAGSDKETTRDLWRKTNSRAAPKKWEMKDHSETRQRKHLTRRGKKMNERADSSHSCLLFPVISSSLGAARILGAGPRSEFTV